MTGRRGALYVKLKLDALSEHTKGKKEKAHPASLRNSKEGGTKKEKTRLFTQKQIL